MTSRQIIIIGFMGSGKTTVAVELARKLNCQALDLDDLITDEQKRSPREIIEADGEEAFRRIERQALREVLPQTNARIIAAGGGAWTTAQNREFIAAQGALAVWLDAPFDLCWRRIEAGLQERPLAQSRELAEALYTTRRPIYELADIRIPVQANESSEDIATKVAHALFKNLEDR